MGEVMQKLKKISTLIIIISMFLCDILFRILDLSILVQGVILCSLVYFYAFGIMFLISKLKSDVSFIKLIKTNILWLFSNTNMLIFLILSNLIVPRNKLIFISVANIFVFYPLVLFIWIKSNGFKNKRRTLFWILRLLAIVLFSSITVPLIVLNISN